MKPKLSQAKEDELLMLWDLHRHTARKALAAHYGVKERVISNLLYQRRLKDIRPKRTISIAHVLTLAAVK